MSKGLNADERMSLQRDESENLSPKAAAFSIASLLTKDIHQNHSGAKSSELNSTLTEPKDGGKCRNGKTEDQSSPKSKFCALSKESCEHYSIQNILNNDHSRGNKCAEGVTNSGIVRRGSLFDPLQQFAACCDLVSNLDSLENSSSFFSPHTPLMDTQREVQVAMQQSDLWWKFYACGTEMVITRTGRRMFPTLALSFLGMDPRRYYSVHVDIVPVDGYAYTFVNNMWQINGMAGEMHALPYVQSYQADEVAHTGLYWMKNGVDFKKVRLTNRRVGPFKDGELHLSPNRKYQPRIHVVEETEEGVKVSCATYVFPETAFIAVTTYQNEELIQMKIDHNPFAKGFRDKGTRRRYSPYEQRESVPDSPQSSLTGICFVPSRSLDRTAESSHNHISSHFRLQSLSHF
ncbi:T-box transcription factor TBX5-A [Acropora cervicornis]|uniref:T-box transcription factor TBX5-A n=1 Tax=Acropora cervicornis TaxID=6130 RepID=A0AAD9VAP7_ACRCE|nr:T-box transcription factor TBX5-A [Acropora cervicornis]